MTTNFCSVNILLEFFRVIHLKCTGEIASKHSLWLRVAPHKGIWKGYSWNSPYKGVKKVTNKIHLIKALNRLPINFTS